MDEIYDVVVVGAGPAGSLAARTAAELGLNVLLVEKRQQVGSPVRCGEIVNNKGISEFIDIDGRWVAKEIKYAKIYLPGGKELVETGDEEDEMLIVLDRKIFDMDLAQRAANAGAHVFVKTSATGIERDGNGVKVSLNRMGDEIKIKCNLVIGADGVESRVGKWAGIDTTLGLDEVGIGVQYLMTDIDFEKDVAQFWYGMEIAPGGYAWVFPKGERTANVGIGIVPALSERSAKNCLDSFIERFRGGKVIETVAGAFPLKGPIDTAVADNIMLAGDAARHTDPFSGAGIINAMKSGRYAGKVAFEAVENQDYSKHFLSKYDELWKSDFGEVLRENRVRLEELIQSLGG